MDLEKEIMNAAYDFGEKYIKPYEKDIELKGKFVKEIFSDLGTHGFIALPFPKEYGGLNKSFTIYAKVAIILSQYSGTLAGVLGAHSLATFSILLGGNKEQKEAYLPDLIKGRKIGSFALTEPNAGSDPSSIETEASKEGDSYVLDGTKAFTTNAGLSDIYVIMAKTDKNRGARGISAFLVHKNDKNFTIGGQEKKMAFPGLPNASLLLNNVKIPKERLLGREGIGFIIAMKTLDIGRISAAAAATGLAKNAFAEALEYSKQRKQSGKSIYSFEMIQSYLAEMATKIRASELIVLDAARAADERRKDLSKLAAMAKYFASDTATRVTRLAVQIFGGYGFIKDYAVERLYRQAKMYEIIEGTTEIQKIIIANSLIKESK